MAFFVFFCSDAKIGLFLFREVVNERTDLRGFRHGVPRLFQFLPRDGVAEVNVEGFALVAVHLVDEQCHLEVEFDAEVGAQP